MKYLRCMKLFCLIVFRKWDGVLITPRMAWDISSSIWLHNQFITFKEWLKSHHNEGVL